MKPRAALRIALLAFAVLLLAPGAGAFPGFFIGKNTQKRYALQSHVVLLKNGGKTAVTVLADYGGPLDDFAVVMPVPSDVTLERVRTLRRDFIDRIDQMTAPRFHEFWEKDPCAPGKAKQIWEVSLTASSQTAFLGGGSTAGKGKEKVAKELLMKVEPEFKETSGEYEYTLVGAGEDVGAWLKDKGYEVTDAITGAVGGYNDMAFLVAEVQSKKLELVAGGRAQLSPIRYWTETDVSKVPAKLGRLSAKGMQDLVVYVLHPDKRFEVKNYPSTFPPTNIEVDFKVKERMGEFYAGLHDAVLKKDPKTFLVEWVGRVSDCGQPCVTQAMRIYEILSLGADAIEQFVPDEEKNPEVPELTEEEEKKLEAKIDAKIDLMEDVKSPAKKKKLKKELLEKEEERRLELARRKALIARHQYLITRLHHRYDDKTLPEDVVVSPAGGSKAGGFDLPTGPKGEMQREVKDGKENQVQLRYAFFHPWKGMQKCEKPTRYRWGKPPRTYRGRRKIWAALELGTMDRDEFVLGEVVKTAIPSLGLTGVVEKPADAGPEGGAAASGEKKKSCGCRVPGAGEAGSGAALFALALVLAGARRRRRRS